MGILFHSPGSLMILVPSDGASFQADPPGRKHREAGIYPTTGVPAEPERGDMGKVASRGRVQPCLVPQCWPAVGLSSQGPRLVSCEMKVCTWNQIRNHERPFQTVPPVPLLLLTSGTQAAWQ